MTERRFGFVQWEFAGRLGPDPGRYPVRRFAGDDVRQIVVIGGYQAPRRTLLPRPRRAKAAKAPEPATVPSAASPGSRTIPQSRHSISPRRRTRCTPPHTGH